MKVIYDTEQTLLCPLSSELIMRTDSRYEKWFYDQEVTKHNSHGLFPYGKKKMLDYIAMAESGEKDIVWAILDRESKEHIGNVSLQRINWINRSAEFAIVIGEQDHWGKGIAFEVLDVLFRHGFSKLNLHRIWTGTVESNIGMIKVAEKLGMILEGRLNEGVFLNGKYEDVLMYGILEDEWIKQIKS